MKCKICNNALVVPSYRQLFPYFNFPAHSSEEWEICRQGLLHENLRPVYGFLQQAVNMTAKLEGKYFDLKNFLNDSGKNFELLLQIDRLGEMVNETFPKADIKVTDHFVPAEIQLDRYTYQKLVAYELERETRTPIFLKNTSKEILNRMQTGDFALNSPFYYGTIPYSRASQSIRVPAELVKAVRYPFIHKERSVERIFMEFAERINISERNEDIAYLILKKDIRPSNIRRRVMGETASYVVNFAQLPGLPGDKRAAIHKSLQSVDSSAIKQLAWEVEKTPLTSTRVDYEDKKAIDRLSKELNLPAYKVVTALLLYANYVKA
ncbi:hypothetical protein DCC39_10420 [Pueribacillus theae]|uniref:Uncharacterized protein n=1 Tax=Pueribacillus theae TaxID=2171751 RepID=A0A2U1K1N6_9BACI|nr:hypothetical protein [Pueribacillus theae]PWA11104.1 hypothetical protein DCC39_10420 [Pueribacillus theae]